MNNRTTFTRSLKSINTPWFLNLPLKRNLTLAYILSSWVALLITIVSAFALLHRGAVYPTRELLLSFVPSDAFALAIGLPLLLDSLWLARRGSLIGLLCWPGVLFYIVYMYIPYVIAVPWSPWTLAYLALIVLSAYTLISVIASIDRAAVRQKLEAFVPARTSGSILIGQAFFFLPAWAFATRMEKPLTWWRKMLPRNTWPFLSKLWIATLVLATVAMLIGLEMAIFGYFPGITNTETLQNINTACIWFSHFVYACVHRWIWSRAHANGTEEASCPVNISYREEKFYD